MPNHGLNSESIDGSFVRKRKSTLSLPIPRIIFCNKLSSSSVECAVASAPIEAEPCSCLILSNPLATYSRAVSQSVTCH